MTRNLAAMAVLAIIRFIIGIGRKMHRLLKPLLMIPFSGIINGLIVPIMIVPTYLLSFSENGTMIYKLFSYNDSPTSSLGYFNG